MTDGMTGGGNDDILSLLEGLYRAVEAGKVAIMPSQMGYGNYSLQNEDKTLCLNFEKDSNIRPARTSPSRIRDYENYIAYRLYQHPAINYTIEKNKSQFEMATKLWKLIELKNTIKSTKDILVIVNALIVKEPAPTNSTLEVSPNTFTACDARRQTKNAYGTADQLLKEILALINESSKYKLDYIYLSRHCNESEYINFKHHENEIGPKLQQLGVMVTNHDNREYPVSHTISWK